MDISFVIRLVDEFSNKARGVKDSLKGVGDAARSGFSSAIKDGFSTENIEAATKNAEAALSRARGRMIGAIGQALTLVAPVIKAGNFQEAFIDFANVAEIPIERMGEIEARLITATRITGKNKSELLEIVAGYVGKGMDLDEAMAAINATGRAATATKATVGDMGNAGFAVMDNLKVGASDLAKAFDVMAASGKEGSFELKDMARHFPELTANAGALQMKGVPAVASLAAALQIAMKSAGSADTAATNMSNFLGKITSPDTVRNFKKLGIDIEKEMKAATANGTDPLLRSLELIQKATGGDEFKMGELFADKQVKDFLRALIPNLQEYQRIRDKAAGAEGIIDKDFENVARGLNSQLRGLVTEIDNLMSSGGTLLPIAQELLAQATALVVAVNDWTRANPELTETIVRAGAGLLAMSVASRVAAFAIAALRMPLIGLASTFLKFENGRNIATGWRVLAGTWRMAAGGASSLASGLVSVMRIVPAFRNGLAGLSMLSAVSGGGLAGAFSVIGTVLASAVAAIGTALAAISAPVWALIALFVAAGFAVWKFWDRISAFASGFAGPVADLLSTGANNLLSEVGKIASGFAEMLGIDLSFLDGWKVAIAHALDFSGLFASMSASLASGWEAVKSFFTPERLSESAKEGFRQAGEDFAKALIEGFKAAVEGLIAVAGNISGRISSAMGSVKNVVRWPWGDPPDQPPASGGPPPYQPQGPDVQGAVNAVIEDKRPPTVQATVSVTNHITTADPVAAGRAAASSAASALTGALNDGGGQ